MNIQENSRLSEAISPPLAVKKILKIPFLPQQCPHVTEVCRSEPAAPSGPENHGNQNAYVDWHIHQRHVAG